MNCPLCGAPIRTLRLTRRLRDATGLYRDWSITEVLDAGSHRLHVLSCPRRGQLRIIDKEARP